MATEGNPQATIVGDLADAPQIPSDSFDCAIVTQTLQFVYDVRAALATLHRILAPGGVLLATVPGHHEDLAARGRGVRRVVALHRRARCAGSPRRRSARGTSRCEPTGTCSRAAGFLYGLAASDLQPEELDARDRLYEVIVGAARRQALAPRRARFAVPETLR